MWNIQALRHTVWLKTPAGTGSFIVLWKTLKSSDALLIMGSEKLCCACLTCITLQLTHSSLFLIPSLQTDTSTRTLPAWFQPRTLGSGAHVLLCSEGGGILCPSAKKSGTSTFTSRWLQHMPRPLKAMFCFLTFHTFFLSLWHVYWPWRVRRDNIGNQSPPSSPDSTIVHLSLI